MQSYKDKDMVKWFVGLCTFTICDTLSRMKAIVHYIGLKMRPPDGECSPQSFNSPNDLYRCIVMIPLSTRADST